MRKMRPISRQRWQNSQPRPAECMTDPKTGEMAIPFSHAIDALVALDVLSEEKGESLTDSLSLLC